jgi:hypothetical protein
MSFRTQLQQTPIQQVPRPVSTPSVVPTNNMAPAERTSTFTEEQQENNKKRETARRKKPDLFMIIAIIVAVIAIGAIAYGIFCNKSQEEPIPFPEIENVEQVIEEEASEITDNELQNQQN